MFQAGIERTLSLPRQVSTAIPAQDWLFLVDSGDRRKLVDRRKTNLAAGWRILFWAWPTAKVVDEVFTAYARPSSDRRHPSVPVSGKTLGENERPTSSVPAPTN